MSFISPAIDISLISLGLVLFSRLLQKKFMDKAKMKKQREEMKEKQKRLKECMARKDEKSMQEATRIQKEMLQSMNETMQGSMKQMVFSLPIFLVAFALLGMVYAKEVISLPIPLPWFGQNGLQLFNETNWFGWYFVSYLVISIAIGIVVKVVENSRKAKVQ